jgi:hypothetical protein
MACANANSYIHAIDENGDVTCATDDGSSYTAGSGIAIDIKNMISIANSGVTTAKLQNNAVTDAKIADMSWGKLSGVPAGFADGVDNDTNTTYSAGSGISISGPANQISVTTVPWASVSGIPTDFADGVDNDTTYSAGPGISINPSNQISVTSIPWTSVNNVPTDLANGDDDSAGVAYDFTNSLVSANAGTFEVASTVTASAPIGHMAVISYSFRYTCKRSGITNGGICSIYPSTIASSRPSINQDHMGYKAIALGSNAQLDGYISGNKVENVASATSNYYLLIEADTNAVITVDEVNFVVMFVPNNY